MSALARAGFGFVASCALAAQVEAGHEFPFYPSFYPQEIRVEVVDPAVASRRLRDGSLHAYVGGDPFAGRAAPPNVGHVESLGSYVVVTFNATSGVFTDRQNRCAAAHKVVAALAQGSFTLHPYPVTPYHGDFLQHFDLAESAKKEYQSRIAGGSSSPPLRIRAKGSLAEKLVRTVGRPSEKVWDLTVETIEVADLLSSRTASLNGWIGPPWIKEGWFHAYLLYFGTVADREVKQTIEATFQRLTIGNYDGLVERLNLERELVTLLRGGCERVIAGFTVRREYFNAEYSRGVENIAHDSHTGLSSPVFPRTVKLKDFPWNGWLNVGIQAKLSAAWNPVGGLSDAPGRLIWSALGDPALFPSPYSASWVPNRVTGTLASTGFPRVDVPQDALIPEPGTGLLLKVGPGRHATAQVLYRVLTSAFHDGSRMTIGDVFYPFIFSYRWGMKRAPHPMEYDPFVDVSTALLRERLVGLRVLRVETDVLAFGDMKLTYHVPVLEVYVNYRSPDPLQVAAIAPPWSSLPWHLIVLMEEAVTRGLAAFSQEAAKRRGVAWMDLARDQKLKNALAQLLEDLARRDYVPDSLKAFVTAGEAKERWTALKRFYEEHYHFLVTNGPYRLHHWSQSSVVLQVFRDLTYPRGLGSFNAYAIPLRAYVSKTELRGDQLEIYAEAEKAERFGREYKIVREPFSKKAFETDKRSFPVCRYVVLGPDGTVVKAGTSEPTASGVFVVSLEMRPRPGSYTILIALSLDGNDVNPDVRVVQWRS